MRIVNESLLQAFREKERCERCGKRVKRLEPHHVRCRGSGRLDIAINIISLCGTFVGGDNCHSCIDNGSLGYDDVLSIVAIREGMPQHQIQAEIDRIRALRYPALEIDGIPGSALWRAKFKRNNHWLEFSGPLNVDDVCKALMEAP